jgi:hypothetical protein
MNVVVFHIFLLFQIMEISAQSNQLFNAGYFYAQIANSTYFETTDAPFKPACGLKLIESFKSSNNHLLLVYQNRNSTVFTFRGFEEFSEVEDVLNLDLVPLFRGNKSLPQSPQVLEGFRDWAMEFVPFVNSLQVKVGDSQIIMVGHSAGAASLYILTAYMSAIWPWFRTRLFQLYTFGSPRPGDQEFADYWKKNVRPLMRTDLRFVMYNSRSWFIQTRDPVTYVPPGDDYVHVTPATLVPCSTLNGDSCSLRELHHMYLYLYSLSLKSQSRNICLSIL